MLKNILTPYKLRYKQGASTITQQLVRHFLLNNNKEIFRKITELILAWKLEKKMSKEKILETYLNNIYFGNGAYGVASAIKILFKRSFRTKFSGKYTSCRPQAQVATTQEFIERKQKRDNYKF